MLPGNLGLKFIKLFFLCQKTLLLFLLVINTNFFQSFLHQSFAEILHKIFKHKEITVIKTKKIQNKIMVLVNSCVPLKLLFSPSDATYHHNSVEEIDNIDKKNNGHQ